MYGAGLHYKVNDTIGVGIGYMINNGATSYPGISEEVDIEIKRLTFFTGYSF